MKKLGLLLIVLLGVVFTGQAQRYAYVDTQYILDNLPEYGEAQEELNRMSEEWMKEIEDKFALVDEKQRQLDKEVILLPEEIRRQREKEIEDLRIDAKELQKRKFGVGGELFQQRKTLIKPIQDKIYNAIQEIATERNYAFVFDKANQSNLLYADPKFDISDQVLRKLGITPKN